MRPPSSCPPSFEARPRPLLIVISGPSGVGKDAIMNRMKETNCPFAYVVTATTRPKRPGEKEGVDYYFVSNARFQEMIQNQELLEYAKVYENWYGVPKAEARKALSSGKDVILRVDIQGAATIKALVPQAVFIFLVPPSMEELARRLMQRRTESPEQLKIRTSKAEEELKKLPSFDYFIVNKRDMLDKAISEIKAIVTAEKCRVNPREIDI